MTETKNKRGRRTNDKRSVVHSIVLGSLPSPDAEGRNPSDRAVAAALGLSPATYRDIVKAVRHKRASLESSEDDKETVYSQVLKSKGRTKVTPELQRLQQKICQFFCGHSFIVASPI